MKTFIDLFCGIGGFRVALERKGLTCVFSSDIDNDVQNAYYQNFGEKPVGDITKIATKKMPRHDILCAGFPCQPFSISGKRNGMAELNGRLFYEIVRIARYHKPSILLLENVKNILSIDDGRVIKAIDDELSAIGYEVHKSLLNASRFGVPQSRERVYFVALKKGLGMDYAEPRETLEKIYLEASLDKCVEKRLVVKRKDIRIDKVFSERKLKPLRMGMVNKGGQGERIYSPLGHAITLSAFGGGVGARTGLYKISDEVRRLSINECKALMTFPANHRVSGGTKGYQQLGNAVMPKMVEIVYDCVRMN